MSTRWTTPEELTKSLKVDEAQIKESATKGGVRRLRFLGRVLILKTEIPKLAAQVATDTAVKPK